MGIGGWGRYLHAGRGSWSAVHQKDFTDQYSLGRSGLWDKSRYFKVERLHRLEHDIADGNHLLFVNFGWSLLELIDYCCDNKSVNTHQGNIIIDKIQFTRHTHWSITLTVLIHRFRTHYYTYSNRPMRPMCAYKLNLFFEFSLVLKVFLI